ncbi:MAG: hypothetical protein LW823_04050 [Rickettsiales bacterium]|jgi:hypothetical protein|nr:hypothetical protein [Rickettsiales bacterium]
MGDPQIDSGLRQFQTGQGGGNTGGGGAAQAKDIPHAVGKEVSHLLTKFFSVPNVDRLGEAGVQLALGGDRGAITDAMINQGGGSLSMKGGFFAKVFDELKSLGMQIIDHTGGIQQLAWTEVPIEALGQITPMNTGASGMGAGEGYSMNA